MKNFELNFRNYLTAAVVFLLLLYGQVDSTKSFYILIRLSYVILIPLFIWFLIGWVWKKFNLTEHLDQILARILFCVFGCAMTVLAIFEFNAKTHIGNTQTVRTYDGYEDVGEDIILTGPDYRTILLYLVAAGFFFWIGIAWNNIGRRKNR